MAKVVPLELKEEIISTYTEAALDCPVSEDVVKWASQIPLAKSLAKFLPRDLLNGKISAVLVIFAIFNSII